LPRPGIGFPRPLADTPPVGASGLPARPGVPPAAREPRSVPGGDLVARVAAEAAVITASPPIAPRLVGGGRWDRPAAPAPGRA